MFSILGPECCKSPGKNLLSVIFVIIFMGSKLPIVFSTSQTKWTHEISVDSGVDVKWDSEDPDFLTMEVSAPTKGYVGIGFSPSGGMLGSDIAIGWVTDDGIPEIQDFHAVGKSMPVRDLQQDYELIAGKEDGGRTTIRFRRRWETCDDKHDMTIGNDTMRLIWAWHAQDPESSPFRMEWHGPSTRGVRSVFMRSPGKPKHFPDDPKRSGNDYSNTHNDKSVKTWDLLMDRVRIDGSKDTVYMCRIVKFPDVSKKHHMIGFRPIISPGNKPFVHHVSVYHCHIPRGSNKTVFAKHVSGQPGECYAPNMPPEWSKHCYTFLFSWAIGSEGEMLPEHVGSPLGESSGETTFFKLEIHYDNPERKQFIDSSGIRIFYTNQTRKFDSSVLLLGHRTSPFQTIPPSQEKFKTFSFCSGQCTRNGIPESGLRVVSAMLHAHLSGRKVKLRHIRDGKELAPIAEDNHYDFNYQQFRILRKEVIILPGDELLVECEYDTSNRQNFTFGGVSTVQEMCQAILFYYPRSPLTDCRSQPELNSYLNAIGIQKAQGNLLKLLNLPYDPIGKLNDNDNIHQHQFLPQDDSLRLESLRNISEVKNPFDLIQISKPTHLLNKSVGDQMRRKDWRQKHVAKTVENEWKRGKHYMYCGGSGQKLIPIENHILDYPQYEKYSEFKNSECRNSRQLRNNGNRLSFSDYLINYFDIAIFSFMCFTLELI